jgi:hypothetical protein
MAGTTLSTILADIKAYRRVYLLAITASFGGMLFGWVVAPSISCEKFQV